MHCLSSRLLLSRIWIHCSCPLYSRCVTYEVHCWTDTHNSTVSGFVCGDVGLDRPTQPCPRGYWCPAGTSVDVKVNLTGARVCHDSFH